MESLEDKYISYIKVHEGIIHKVAGLYTNLSEDKNDLVQEMMLQGWRSFTKFKGTSKFSTWLYKVCLNTALTFKKKEAYRKDAMGKIPLQEVQAPKEDYEVLYFLIKQLDEVDRMIITLHLEGFKNPEIAEISGMTTNNINVKLHRIKAHIIDQYKTSDYG